MAKKDAIIKKWTEPDRLKEISEWAVREQVSRYFYFLIFAFSPYILPFSS